MVAPCSCRLWQNAQHGWQLDARRPGPHTPGNRQGKQGLGRAVMGVLWTATGEASRGWTGLLWVYRWPQARQAGAAQGCDGCVDGHRRGCSRLSGTVAQVCSSRACCHACTSPRGCSCRACTCAGRHNVGAFECLPVPGTPPVCPRCLPCPSLAA